MVFSLGGWSPRLHTGFLVSRATPDTASLNALSCTGLSPPMAGFPKTVPLKRSSDYAVHYPKVHVPWFGLLRFRSPLLPESMFLSFPPGT